MEMQEVHCPHRIAQQESELIIQNSPDPPLHLPPLLRIVANQEGKNGDMEFSDIRTHNGTYNAVILEKG